VTYYFKEFFSGCKININILYRLLLFKNDLRFTKAHIFIKKYYELKSFSAVQSAFRVKFKVKVAPGHQIIKNIVQAFEKSGSVVPGRSKCQIPTQKRQEAKKQLETMVKEFPNLSIRKAD